MVKITLYKIKDSCRDLEYHCHNHFNRALTCMKDNPDSCKLVSEYLNLCLINEKLCSYICCICCNSNKMNNSLKSECKKKCNEMKKCCENIKKSKKKMKNIDLDHLGVGKMIEKCNTCIDLMEKFK